MRFNTFLGRVHFLNKEKEFCVEPKVLRRCSCREKEVDKI